MRPSWTVHACSPGVASGLQVAGASRQRWRPRPARPTGAFRGWRRGGRHDAAAGIDAGKLATGFRRRMRQPSPVAKAAVQVTRRSGQGGAHRIQHVRCVEKRSQGCCPSVARLSYAAGHGSRQRVLARGSFGGCAARRRNSRGARQEGLWRRIDSCFPCRCCYPRGQAGGGLALRKQVVASAGRAGGCPGKRSLIRTHAWGPGNFPLNPSFAAAKRRAHVVSAGAPCGLSAPRRAGNGMPRPEPSP